MAQLIVYPNSENVTYTRLQGSGVACTTTDTWFGGKAAMWSAPLTSSAFYSAWGYVKVSNLLPANHGPECITGVSISFSYCNFYCERTKTVCDSGVIGLGTSRTSSFVHSTYTSSATQPTSWYSDINMRYQENLQTATQSSDTSGETYFHFKIEGQSESDGMWFWGGAFVINSITIDYNSNSGQTPSFSANPSVSGSTTTPQDLGSPTNSVPLSCGSTNLSCPSATVSCTWTISKGGNIIQTLTGFTATATTLTSVGEYIIRATLSSTQNSNTTYKEVVVNVHQLVGTGVLLYKGQTITNTTGRVPAYTPMEITISGITGYDGNATYTWTATNPTDCEITDSEVGSCTFTPFDTTKTYVLTYSITSYGITKTVTFDAGVAISCYKGVITSFSLDRYEGSTTDEFTTTNASYIPNEDPQPTITSVWTIYDSGGIEVPSSDITIISGSMTSENFVFSMNIPGTFAVTLVSSSSGYDDGTYTRIIQIGLVLDISLGAVSRYSVALDNRGVVALINRNCNTQFSGLVYMKSLNQTGSATFKVIGANKFTKVVGGSVVSATDDLMRVGTRVTIIDNMVPIWMGVISSITEVNQNYFNNVVSTRVFELECDESIKQLSFDYVPLANTGTVNGTIPYIVGKILDSSNIGVVANSHVNYAVSIETTSRLAALDSLSNQLGWRYRCRPEIHMYYQDISCALDTTYTIATGSNTTDGCIAVIYDSEGGSGYRIGYIDNFTAGTTDTFTFSQQFDTNDFDSTSTSLKVSIFGTYLIDYKPTYYQEYIPVMYKINQYAQNVTDLASSKDKYGEVSVYGVGYSGEHLASNMRAWMIINPDYTISKSARIATSYDCTLDSISKIDTVVGAVTPSKSFGRYNLVLNGWSFPTTINANYVPTVFYSNSYEDSGTVYRHLRKVELTYDSSECPNLTQNPRFFYDQNNNKKTAYTISVDLDPTNHDDDGVHYSSVVSSFIPMTNIVFNRVVLAGADGRDGTYWLPAADEDIRIGDMHATVNTKNATLETLVFNWDVPSVDKVNGVDAPWDDTDTPTPHGHMTDVLVIDDSMTVITEGNYDNPVPSSPKYNYPTINQTILGPEGYSLMELERLACRYMQYGSNYSDRGSCKIPLPVFRRQDYNIGGYRIPMVGDRIAFQKAKVNNATSDADYTLQNYELQSYKVDTDKMVCEVKYGMPFVLLGDVLYNMLSNSGMSILPSDSEDNV